MGALRSLLEQEGLAGLLVIAESSSDTDMAPFVGSAHLGESFVLVSRQGEVRLGFMTDMERDEAGSTGLELLTPGALGVPALRAGGAEPGQFWGVVLASAFDLSELGRGEVAVAGHAPAGTIVEATSLLSAAGWSWRSGSELLRRWRKFKPAGWRERMALPAAGTCAAMRAVARVLRRAAVDPDGGLTASGRAVTVGRVREIVSVEFAQRGLTEPEGNIVAPGAAGGVPHSRGENDRVLRTGEPIVVDLFPKGEIFADCTRTFCVGEPAPDFKEAYALVRQALERAHEMARPEARAWDLQAAICDLFEDAGHATLRTDPEARVGYVHGLGHGVGFELHEYPSFRQHAGGEGTIEVGDLLTLEPGLYDAERGFGVRLEDLVYVGAEGNENLTPLPLEWDPALWPQDA